MKKFKKWSERYKAVVIPTETVFNFDDKYNETGIFHWEVNKTNGGIISDPDKYLNKKANEILEDLFEVRKVKKKGLIIAYVIFTIIAKVYRIFFTFLSDLLPFLLFFPVLFNYFFHYFYYFPSFI